MKKIFFNICLLTAIVFLSSMSFAQEANLKPIDPRTYTSHPDLMQAVLDRMDSADLKTRLEAGLLLRDVARTSDLALLLQVLKKGNILDKQLFIIDALGRLGDPRAGTALRFEIENGDPLAKRAAISALGKLEFDWPIPILAQELLKDATREVVDEKLVMRAAAAMGEIGSTRAIDSLKSVIARNRSASLGVKNASYWALRKAEGQIPDDKLDTEIEVGRQLQLNYKGYEYFFYVPSASANLYDKPWLLICVHDSDREVKALFDACWNKGKELRMAVLMPYFDVMRFPDYGDFNIWGKRADKHLLKLIEHVGIYAGVNTKEVYLYGSGEGGDFVQRFSMAYPERIARAAFASINYTTPQENLLFPVGIGINPLADDLKIDLLKFIKSDVAVISLKTSNINAIQNERYAKDYLQRLNVFSTKNAVRSRIATRSVSAMSLDVQSSVFQGAAVYLFSEN